MSAPDSQGGKRLDPLIVTAVRDHMRQVEAERDEARAEQERLNRVIGLMQVDAARLESEVTRLRDIIGRLYMERGRDRHTLYRLICRAFREASGDD